MLEPRNNSSKKSTKVAKHQLFTQSVESFTKGRFSPIFLLVVLVLSISFLTRLALLIKTGKSFDWSLKNLTGSFAIGAFFDLAMSTYLILPFVFQLWLTNEKMYQPKYKIFALAAYVLIICMLLFTNIVPADFNPDLKKGVVAYIILRFLIFVFLLFKNNGFRKKWRTGVLYFDFFLVIFLLLFNAISEWFFWDEFSV